VWLPTKHALNPLELALQILSIEILAEREGESKREKNHNGGVNDGGVSWQPCKLV
jgi:hypothetical protein